MGVPFLFFVANGLFFAVARVAYISSDLVLSVQPGLGRDSEFSSTLRSLAAEKAHGIIAKDFPEVRIYGGNLGPLSR